MDLLDRGNVQDERRYARLPPALITKEELRPVLSDGTAQAHSKKVVAQGRFGRGECREAESASIEDVIAEIFVNRAVEVIRAGLGRNLDDSAAGTPQLGGV